LKKLSQRFDVIIIGAGIGGLTCGCYLAKAGLKVLIVEQHNKPGGYCTSFERQGYRFDVGVHYFGGVKNGLLGKVLKELSLTDKIKFNRFDPSDKIIMPDNITYVRTDPYDTIKEFQKSFPKEKKNVERFFKFILQKNFMNVYAKTRGLTFKQVVDDFFNDYKLKSTLGVLVSNIGASPSYAVAFPSMILLRQYSLEPGYYPIGGIQAFPDMLSNNIQENGGHLILSKKVIKIVTKNKVVQSIILENGEKIDAKIIVSNADATETFRELLSQECPELNMLNRMQLSPSMFIVYIGIEADLKKILTKSCNVFYFSSYNVDKVFNEKNILKNNIGWLVCDFATLHDPALNSSKNAVIIMMSVPYKSPAFWDKNKNILCERLLYKVEKLKIIPNLDKYIKLRIIATPHTLYKYTSNKEGAFAGWLPTLRQTERIYIPQKTSFHNLYLTGHWCSTGYLHYGGIPNVVFLGRRAASLVLKKIRKI